MRAERENSNLDSTNTTDDLAKKTDAFIKRGPFLRKVSRMSGKMKGWLLGIGLVTVACLLAVAAIKVQNERGGIWVPLSAGVIVAAGYAGYYLAKRYDQQELDRTRQLNLIPFTALGIPEEAVHAVSDDSRRFFGIAIDKEKWMLYLMESRNVEESLAAGNRLRTYAFESIDRITCDRALRTTVTSKPAGHSDTFGFTKNDFYHSTTNHYKYNATQHTVGHVLHLHLKNGSTESYELSPSKRLRHSHDCERIVSTLEAALAAYEQAHPRAPKEPPAPSPLSRYWR